MTAASRFLLEGGQPFLLQVASHDSGSRSPRKAAILFFCGHYLLLPVCLRAFAALPPYQNKRKLQEVSRTPLAMGLDVLGLLRRELPVASEEISVSAEKHVGLVIVDEVKGFCSVGCGHLAPPSHNQQIAHMVEETNKLAREFSVRHWPMLALLDTHDANRPEPPYPPHCIKGSGEDELVPELKWLEHDRNTHILRKDCINGYIAGLRPDGTNVVSEWVKAKNIKTIIVVGICTDICVLDFVVTVLSARNHGVLAPLEEVVVYTEGCATYDLPKEVAEGITGAIAHPQGLTHHIGLYMAKSRGARLVDKIKFS